MILLLKTSISVGVVEKVAVEMDGLVLELEKLLSKVKSLEQLVLFKEGEEVELAKGSEAPVV